MKRKIYLLCVLLLSLHFIIEFPNIRTQVLTYSLLVKRDTFNFFDNLNLFLMIAAGVFVLIGLIFWFIQFKKEKSSKVVTVSVLFCSLIITYLALYNGIYEINAIYKMKEIHNTINLDYYLAPIFTLLKYLLYAFILFRYLIGEDEANQNGFLVALSNGLILVIISLNLLACTNQLFDSCAVFEGQVNTNSIVELSITALVLILTIISIYSFYSRTKYKLIKPAFLFSIIGFVLMTMLRYISAYILYQDFLKNGYRIELLLFIIVSVVFYIITARLTKAKN